MTTADKNGGPAPSVITAPVSRTLAVASLEHSIAFYRDVLGFSLATGSADTLVQGSAQLHFTQSVDNEAMPFQPAIIFLEVSEVEAMRTAIRARGGHPSEIARVNWIKVELFSLQDPDGHVLWFGRSYHEFYLDMHTPPGDGQLRQIMPAFPCTRVAAAVDYYRDVLGFSINYQQDDLGVMDRDNVRLLLVSRSQQHSGIGSCSVYIRDADALYAELIAKGAQIPGPPVSQPWGLRDFQVIDPEGNVISFAQTFE